MLLGKRAKKHHIANIVLSTNSYYFPCDHAFYSPGEGGQSSSSVSLLSPGLSSVELLG